MKDEKVIPFRKKEKVKNEEMILVKLPADIIESIKVLANKQGLTATAALRQALSDELLIQKEVREGRCKLILKESRTGEMREVIWRDK